MKRRKVTREFKREAVKLITERGVSVAQLCKQDLVIPGREIFEAFESCHELSRLLAFLRSSYRETHSREKIFSLRWLSRLAENRQFSALCLLQFNSQVTALDASR